MLSIHKVYYTIEFRELNESGDVLDSVYTFLCSYSTYNDALNKVDELKRCDNLREYRILKIEKDVEDVT